MRAEFKELRSDFSFMREDMRGMKRHLSALVDAEARHDGEMAAVRERLDRIETRLGLVDSTH